MVEMFEIEWYDQIALRHWTRTHGLVEDPKTPNLEGNHAKL